MLVSIIIPAHNAASTIARTLVSAREQTWHNLEIIVVDDASSDETVAIAERHAAVDPRVRTISAPRNLGVGGARNLGAASASGNVFCFVDADDLLTPDAVSARMHRMAETGAHLCYAWSAIIDDDDTILNVLNRQTLNGRVFEDLALLGNVLGNGSAVQVTREAFHSVGGYSEALFAAGVQGCEDYKFYLDVAREFPFACCEDVLIGYRQSHNNMSSNTAKMLTSFRLVQQELVARDRYLAPLARKALSHYLFYTLLSCARRKRFGEGFRYVSMLRYDLARDILQLTGSVVRRRFNRGKMEPLIGTSFMQLSQPDMTRLAA